MTAYQCALIVLTALAMLVTSTAPAENEPVERGEYLARIMDCGGCHTPGVLMGEPDQSRYLAGSEVGFHVPGYGVVYPPNLTPDPATGLGQWSKEEIMRAVRQGRRPDGTELAPIMPWPMYANLTDSDARALAAYIKNLPPVEHATPARVEDVEQATHSFLTIQTPE